MAKLVKKDTVMYEPINVHGDTVRRQVFAGQSIPDHWIAGDDTAKGAIEDDSDHAETAKTATTRRRRTSKSDAS